MTHTSSYSVLEVSIACYMEVKDKLLAAGTLDDYLLKNDDDDDYPEVIVFGTTALAYKEDKPSLASEILKDIVTPGE